MQTWHESSLPRHAPAVCIAVHTENSNGGADLWMIRVVDQCPCGIHVGMPAAALWSSIPQV